MEKISKKDFCLLLAIKPHSVIGKEISLKDGNFVMILDVSLGGDYIYIRGYGPEPTWIRTDILDEDFIIDSPPTKAGIISAKSLEHIDNRMTRYSKSNRKYI